jgi:hypothetical protein
LAATAAISASELWPAPSSIAPWPSLSSSARMNAVKTQIWIAVSVYVPVAIVKKRLGLDASLYTLLQILSLTLFEKMPILQALSQEPPPTADLVENNQLNLFSS